MLDGVGAFALEAPPRLTGLRAADLRLMAEIAFLALSEGRAAAVRPVFEMIDAAQPDNAAGAIGLAIIEAGAGREREALARLRKAVLTRRRSINEAKATFCVLAAACGRESDAAQWRRELLRGPDCAARRLAAASPPQRR